MTLQEIVDKTFDRMKTFRVEGLLPALRQANEGALDDVLNINGCANYQFSACLVDVLKPKQIVELGGAMGVWSLCVLHTLPEDSKLYSITLEEGGLEYSYVVDKYKNFTPVIGDDLDLSNWPKNLDLSKTDIWYFDSLHTPEHLTKELELYSPFFKKGTILLFDDIHSFGLESVWEKIQAKYEAKDISDPCHWSGWGICKAKYEI